MATCVLRQPRGKGGINWVKILQREKRRGVSPVFVRDRIWSSVIEEEDKGRGRVSHALSHAGEGFPDYASLAGRREGGRCSFSFRWENRAVPAIS